MGNLYALGSHHTEEWKLERSEALKGNLFAFGHKHTAKHKQKIGEDMKVLWQNPEYVANVVKGQAVKPTKPELALKAILDKHFPEFRYNGDYSLGITLASMIPDFVNVNGKKEVIELFGDYWHSPKMTKNRWKQTELGRIMAYNSLGYKCLVIWEYELRDEQAVIKRIIGLDDT